MRNLFLHLLITFLFFHSISSNSQSWTAINTPTTSTINSCYFLSETLGWIVTNEAIYKTIDGGANWVSQDFPTAPSQNIRMFKSVHFIDNNVGIIACGNYLYSGHDPSLVSSILWTNDGGQNWVYKDLGGSSFDLSAILITPLIAYSISSYGQSKKTTDGGSSWTPVNFSNVGYSGANLFGLDQNNIYFAGLQSFSLTGAIGKLNNSTWMINDFPETIAMQCIFFIDQNKGWVVGNGGTIKVTSNGGANWTSAVSNVTSTIHGVSFMNPNQGWSATVDGKILKSIDGGMNWAIEYNGDTTLHDITFKNLNGYGYAVGNNGRILKYNSNLSINEFDTDEYVIFPNPASNSFTITSGVSAEKVQMEIVDSAGRIVKKIKEFEARDNLVDIRDLGKGFYYLLILDSNNQFHIRKIIKN